MIIHRYPNQIKQGCHLLMGNFDGVHKGHQKLIEVARKKAYASGKPLACLIFNPHPKLVLGFEHEPIQTPYDQWLTLKIYGIEELFVLRFTHAISQLTPEAFIDQILKPIDPSCIYVGEDFRFGYQRKGNIDTLKQRFNVQASKLHHMDNQKLGSSTCRKFLKEGNLEALQAHLGRPFHISGTVHKGQQLGRKLGYPTANLHAKSHPLAGIYAATTLLPDQRLIPSAVSIGYRPFKPINHGLLEAHLIDFNENLYGQRLTVIFHKKIRDQKTFDNTQDLIAQMDHDLITIKQFFRDSKLCT